MVSAFFISIPLLKEETYSTHELIMEITVEYRLYHHPDIQTYTQIPTEDPRCQAPRSILPALRIKAIRKDVL